MIKIKYAIFLILIVLVSIRCIDEIKLDINNDHQKLVVDGLISDSLQLQTVRVNYSAIIGVGTDNIMTPISGAMVKVLDEVGGSVSFPEIEPGIYGTETKGEVSHTYHVEVVLPDGKKVMSRPAKLQPSPKIGDVKAEVVNDSYLSPSGNVITSERLRLAMNLDATGLTARPYLRWRASGEYEFREGYPGALSTKWCYVKNNVDINLIKVFDTNDLAGDFLENEPFLETAYDYRFGTQYCFHLFQYSIPKEEYDYWKRVEDIVNIDGSLFDPPPGTVKGNIYNPDDANDFVVGYFSVAGVSYRREFMNGDSLGHFVEPRCHGLGFRPTPADCYDCLNIIGSSLGKPSYWP